MHFEHTFGICTLTYCTLFVDEIRYTRFAIEEMRNDKKKRSK